MRGSEVKKATILIDFDFISLELLAVAKHW